MQSFEISSDGWADVSCPYCGEGLTVHLDPESLGELVQDCEVCCQPWHMIIDRRTTPHQVRIDIL